MITVERIGNFVEIMRKEIEAGEKAVTAAMAQAGAGLKADWRAQILRAGLGERLPRTIRNATYPAGDVSMNAAAVVYSTAPKLIGVFARGEVIHSKDSMWLAIPTEAAGTRGRGGKRITPAEWSARTGMALRFVYRRNRPSLLVADGSRINSRGRAVMSKAKVQSDGMQRGAVTSVIFVLVRQVTIRKRLDIEAVADRWANRIPDLIVANWKSPNAPPTVQKRLDRLASSQKAALRSQVVSSEVRSTISAARRAAKDFG